MGDTQHDAFIDELFVLLGVLKVPEGLLRPEAHTRLSGSKGSGTLVVPGKEGKAVKKSSLKAEIQRLSEAVAMHVYVYFKGLPSWAELFHRRMVKDKTLVTTEQVEQWVDALSVYQKLSKKKKKRSPVCVEMTESLLDFLTEHIHDPDNALIGLTPREHVFGTHYERTADGKRFRLQHKEAGDRGPDAAVLKARAGNRLGKGRSSFRLSRSGGMGGSSSSKEAAPLGGGDLFRPGQLAIWFYQSLFIPETSTFCRISGQYNEEGGTVAVHDDPLEEQVRVANITDLLPFHEDMVGFLGHVRTMQNLVADPVDGLFASITLQVKAKSEAYLTEAGVDVQALNKVFDGTPSISDLPLLTSALQYISKMIEEPPKEFYDQLDEYGKAEVDKFMEKGMALFEPTRNEGQKQLQEMQFHSLAVSRLQRLKGNCDSALDGLGLEKRLLMNGTKKNELSNWWLGAIERSTDSFLTSISFDHKAVPEDYIEKAPSNLKPIRANLEVWPSALSCVLSLSVCIYIYVCMCIYLSRLSSLSCVSSLSPCFMPRRPADLCHSSYLQSSTRKRTNTTS